MRDGVSRIGDAGRVLLEEDEGQPVLRGVGRGLASLGRNDALDEDVEGRSLDHMIGDEVVRVAALLLVEDEAPSEGDKVVLLRQVILKPLVISIAHCLQFNRFCNRTLPRKCLGTSCGKAFSTTAVYLR